MATLRETDLYEPVKALLEQQGYEVKAEVGAADVMAVRGDDPPILVELKTGFTLALVHQAIERLKISDAVYVAIPEWKGRSGWKAFAANRILCRRLEIGLITVRVTDGTAQVHLDPGPYAPRQSKPRSERLLKEFARRVGDPNTGGMTRATIMTAYRQDALRCLNCLNLHGPTKASEVATRTEVSRARTIMADDHYGWFERVGRGIYGLTPNGEKAVAEYLSELEKFS